MSTTGLPQVINGPTSTSPSAQAFTTDPSDGPGYFVPGAPQQSIATLGPPVTTLPNPEAMQYTNATSGTIASVYANEQAGSCPLPGPSAQGSNIGAEYISPVSSPIWSGASLKWSLTITNGLNWGGTSAPSPATNSNNTLGETGTEQRLIALGVDGAQQGKNAISGVVSFNAGINPANVQTFKWQ